jgi:hypothetical protein
MLLIDAARLTERGGIARGALAPLHDSLREDLQPVLAPRPEVPRVKALLSRAGGRCENDGTLLDFDPRSPNLHRCPRCGTLHEGEVHHRAWVTNFQLWLAERAVHAAMFAALDGNARHAEFARDVLREYADCYEEYPNRDNVLGPTRLFFSTYLESIWLLQICIAASFLERTGDSATADVVRDQIVQPSSALIGEYDEGMSNRQVWNNAALLAAAILLGDRGAFERIVDSDSGLEAHLANALLADGTWYEGENYHQFALRGLWYGVMLAETAGRRIEPHLSLRFESAFVAPFLTALPDFTLPSRKDSQYAVSLRQWRYAELTELGFARSGDSRLAAALGRCYEDGHERRDTGRSRSTADVERNGPSSALSRADLGWRALLFATPVLPELPPLSPRSALLEQQGIAVFRREDDAYVALDFGQSGGGHGHPDRLNLLLSLGDKRVLDDLGTGSYVDPSLHWYRSTLAHNAPLVNGRSQPLSDGVLRAYDEREGLGWVVATFDCGDVRLERMLIVAPDYFIDELRWQAPDGTRVDLPWHCDAPDDAEWSPGDLPHAAGVEDGFSFVDEVRVSHRSVPVRFETSGPMQVVGTADGDVDLFRASGPGQPASVMRRFFLVSARQATGRFRTVLSWSPLPHAVSFANDSIAVTLTTDERHVYRRDDAGLHVDLSAGGARSSVDLAGFRVPQQPRAIVAATATRPAPIVVQRSADVPRWLTNDDPAFRARTFSRVLTHAHYRRSEDSWATAGSPSADVAVAATSGSLVVYADIRAGHLRFATVNAVNPYDNEHADTLAAGIQLYARTPDGSGAWTLVPETDGDAVRVRKIVGWENIRAPQARWRRTESGYEVRVDLPLPPGATEYPVDLDVIINETTEGRDRRRGQLVLSGASGEFVYLRGDRHDPARLIPFLVVE